MAGLPITNVPSIPSTQTEVSQGTSPLFSVKPQAYVPKKIAIPPVPNGWQYVGGPVKDVTKLGAIPSGVRRITKPSNVAKIAYGTYGFRTVYWKAPNGDVYASLDGKVPQTYYEGDVKKTVYHHVIFAYRWSGFEGQIGTGGSTPINSSLVSTGQAAEEQTPDNPPLIIPPIGLPGGGGGTPSSVETPEQDVQPGGGLPGGGWSYQSNLASDNAPGEPEGGPNYLLYGAVGLGVLVAAAALWRTI